MILILTVTNEDSEILDTVELTSEELEQAQNNGLAAMAILAELSVGVTK